MSMESRQDSSESSHVKEFASDSDARALLADLDRVYGAEQTDIGLERLFSGKPLDVTKEMSSFAAAPLPNEFIKGVERLEEEYGQETILNALDALSRERKAAKE
jgi:hypothetical protein